MTYWDMLLKEVMNKHDASATFCFAPRNNHGVEGMIKKTIRKKSRRKKSIDQYTLGEKYPNIVFTYRESQCMKHAIKGKTIPKIAKTMKLSPRTVEFYFGKMRRKLHCRTKSELIEKVIESDFLRNFSNRKMKAS